jgi:hypothetical protein
MAATTAIAPVAKPTVHLLVSHVIVARSYGVLEVIVVSHRIPSRRNTAAD